MFNHGHQEGFGGVGHLHWRAHNYPKELKKVNIICEGVGHLIKFSVDQSHNKQRHRLNEQHFTWEAQGRWFKWFRWFSHISFFHLNSLWLSPVGLKNTQIWNLRRKKYAPICQCDLSAHCRLCCLAITQFPLFFCKTAISSGGGSGLSKFNLPAHNSLLPSATRPRPTSHTSY